MSYKTILTYLDTYATQENLVRTAAILAEKFEAILIGMSALAVRSPLVEEEMVIAGLTEPEITETLSTKEKFFRAQIKAEHLEVEWRSIVDSPTHALSNEARAADMVLIGQNREEGDTYTRLEPAGAVLKCGRPVIIVPMAVSSLQAEYVMIGWKETREARRAIKDAIPILKKARDVTIVEICPLGHKAKAWSNLNDVAHFLQRHEVKAKVEVLRETQESDGAQIIGFARDRGADLIVTGAYGHSRLGEWIFGGMTRELLHSSPVSCFMSH